MSEVGFLVGRTVVELRDDARVVFDPSEPPLYVDVSVSSCIDERGVSMPLSALIGRTVASASAEGGVLHLEFSDRVTLRCPPDPAFEAWQVVGGWPQYLVVCSPGGELAVWDARHRPTEAEAQETVRRANEVFGWNLRLREINEHGGIIASQDTPPEEE